LLLLLALAAWMMEGVEMRVFGCLAVWLAVWLCGWFVLLCCYLLHPGLSCHHSSLVFTQVPCERKRSSTTVGSAVG